MMVSSSSVDRGEHRRETTAKLNSAPLGSESLAVPRYGTNPVLALLRRRLMDRRRPLRAPGCVDQAVGSGRSPRAHGFARGSGLRLPSIYE